MTRHAPAARQGGDTRRGKPSASAPDKAFQAKVHCAHDALEPLAKLRPNPRNPNKHPAQQIELLAKIIAAQGWRNPIVVSNRSGLITKGHARLAAGIKLNADRVPVDYQDYDTEEQEEADLIADNRIAELAEMDEDLLVPMLQKLQASGMDMELSGYDRDALNSLYSSAPDAILAALGKQRIKIKWDQFKFFHCTIGDASFCLDKFNYLISYGSMAGKEPARKRHANGLVFIDSGMLTLAAKIGLKALKLQQEVLAYADLVGGDWVAMMDVPQVPEVLDFLKVTPKRAMELHMANVKEFANLNTTRRKVFVCQGQNLEDYNRCAAAMQSYVTDKDIVAIGSIKNRSADVKTVAAICATVTKTFQKNDIHLFGISGPQTVLLCHKFGATSADSSVGSGSLQYGKIVIAEKNANGVQAKQYVLSELTKIPELTFGGKLYLALSAFSMAQTEAAIGLNMAMEELATLHQLGAYEMTRELSTPPVEQPDDNR